MATRYEQIKRDARDLTPEEKAALARDLIEDLDESADPDVERLWIEEAQRRYEAYLAGHVQSRPGDEVMKRARQGLE